MPRSTDKALLAVALAMSLPAFAHHEAIFGPQSSLVLSALFLFGDHPRA
jgi:hypothetical protein